MRKPTVKRLSEPPQPKTPMVPMLLMTDEVERAQDDFCVQSEYDNISDGDEEQQRFQEELGLSSWSGGAAHAVGLQRDSMSVLGRTSDGGRTPEGVSPRDSRAELSPAGSADVLPRVVVSAPHLSVSSDSGSRTSNRMSLKERLTLRSPRGGSSIFNSSDDALQDAAVAATTPQKSPRRGASTIFGKKSDAAPADNAEAPNGSSPDAAPEGVRRGPLFRKSSQSKSPRGEGEAAHRSGEPVSPGTERLVPMAVPSIQLEELPRTSGMRIRGRSPRGAGMAGLAAPSKDAHDSGAAAAEKIGSPSEKKDSGGSRFVTFSRRSKSMASIVQPNSPAEDELAGPGLFGMPLDELMARNDAAAALDVPLVMKALIDAIVRSDGYGAEGIFRLSTGTLTKKAAMLRLHQFDYQEICSGTDVGDPHLYSVLLKEWLKRLPQPLISDYKACLAMAQQEAAEQRVTMQRLWDDMTPNSRAVLRRLMLFAHELAAHSEKTRMTARNLCIVFAPGIIHPLEEQSALDMLRDQPLTQEALEMVYNYVVTNHRGSAVAADVRLPIDDGGGVSIKSDPVVAPATLSAQDLSSIAPLDI